MTTPQLEKAYKLGFLEAARWASRDDLRHDITSPAYLTQRDHDLAALATQAQGQDAAPAEQDTVAALKSRADALAARVAELEKDAEQARTEPHNAEDAPSDELQRFNEAQERTDFEAHLKAELKAHWIYNNPNGHDLVDMMVSVIPDEINGHKQTNAGRYVDKGVETQWHGWRARAECAAIAQERKA